LVRWRAEPIAFIGEVLRNPETGKPFELLDAERQFLAHSYKTDDSGRLLYPEQVYACPEKSDKSAFGAMYLLTTTILYGGKFAEAFALANDLEQPQGRVFQSARRVVEASPLLRREAANGDGRWLLEVELEARGLPSFGHTCLSAKTCGFPHGGGQRGRFGHRTVACSRRDPADRAGRSSSLRFPVGRVYEERARAARERSERSGDRARGSSLAG
jgi:hypothetical protein